MLFEIQACTSSAHGLWQPQEEVGQTLSQQVYSFQKLMATRPLLRFLTRSQSTYGAI